MKYLLWLVDLLLKIFVDSLSFCSERFKKQNASCWDSTQTSALLLLLPLLFSFIHSCVSRAVSLVFNRMMTCILSFLPPLLLSIALCLNTCQSVMKPRLQSSLHGPALGPVTHSDVTVSPEIQHRPAVF